MDTNAIVVAVLAMACVGGLAWVFIYPLLSGERRAEQRQKALVQRSSDRRAELVARTAVNRRDQVAQSLKEIEARQNAKAKRTLDQRIAQAGLDWSVSRFYMVSAAGGAVVLVALFVLTASPIVAALGAFAAALGLPRWTLGYLTRRRIEAFVAELPNAIDIIVRGIRSGLPLGDCVREIASNAAEPLRSEFRTVIESQAVGVPLSEAIQKLADRIPISETSFFAIVISIQSKAGGNLSEALGNLSRVLRDRAKMQGKVRAMSMEAKASAAIIASLPFVVAVITYITSPEYISLLWTTTLGKISLGICALWMMVGVGVMKKMISFEI